jgi:deoxyribodipyrimidine photo-lyase
VIVPSSMLGREHFAARTIRLRIREHLDHFLVPVGNRRVHVRWKMPCKLQSLRRGIELLADLKLDRSVQPAPEFRGGTIEALSELRGFVRNGLAGYKENRNHPKLDGTRRLSP